ncbi:FadR family transcriptional regulator [Kibdelosporangium aridum]|uniref:FadR family transcriptional regulator n=1 Tax=Kibdelosporangium aridum TaxID=2030 RepID=A0A428Z400_KIBAR|nr:FCD domain-containing protein [Kibdelosporangium aridum]RSM80933.1 FadR family transcriptional regulator [Kibdelosporangium aridum]
MPFSPEPVRRPREQVEKQLRDAIMSSTFKRGERLPSEAELSREFQVSRSTVREALRVLASEGLISKVPGAGGGSFVQKVDHESLTSLISGSLETILKFGSLTMDEINDVRRMLEVPAARLAAQNRTQDQVAEFTRLIDRQNEMMNQPSRDSRDPELFELGQSIFTLVAEASGNRLLASFVSAMSGVTIPVYMRDLPAEDAAAARDLTGVLVDAIVRGDGDKAAAAMTSQLDMVHRHAL